MPHHINIAELRANFCLLSRLSLICLVLKKPCSHDRPLLLREALELVMDV
jgi:hypothetical protein